MNRQVTWVVVVGCLFVAALNVGSLIGIVDVNERLLRSLTLAMFAGVGAIFVLSKRKQS
jgi:uncharacterized membrane protein